MDDAPRRLLQTGFLATGVEDGGASFREVPSTDPAGITFHAPSGTVFVSDSEINETGLPWTLVQANIFRILPASGELIASYRIANSEPTGITYSEADDHFYVSNDDSNTITRYGFDGSNFVALDQAVVPVPPGREHADAEGISSDPDTGRLYVVDGAAYISVWSYSAGFQLEGSIDLRETAPRRLRIADPEGIAYDPSSSHLFLVSQRDEAIVEYTLAGEFVGAQDLSGFMPAPITPQGLAAIPHADGPMITFLVADGGVDNDEPGDVRQGSLYAAIALGGAICEE